MNAAALHASDMFLAVTAHDALPSPPLPPMLPHVEGTKLEWFPSFAKLARRVLVESSAAVQQGHDVGLFIPHVPIPAWPTNWALAKTIPASSCKAMYGCATVLVQGLPIAAYSPGVANLLACADPASMPLGEVPTALVGRTVRVGLSLADLARGRADVEIDQALSLGLRAAFRAVAKPSVDAISRRIVASWARWGWTREPTADAVQLVTSVLDKQARTWLKKGVGKLVPAAKSAIGRRLVADAPPAVDPAAIYDDGMLDAIPRLQGAP
ncbi:MAG: hypothetical protein K1X88_04250 [Nannocystaceae bacterium]|nr:hypothetical protein [Nannocystaceae bacterium]